MAGPRIQPLDKTKEAIAAEKRAEARRLDFDRQHAVLQQTRSERRSRYIQGATGEKHWAWVAHDAANKTFHGGAARSQYPTQDRFAAVEMPKGPKG